MTPPGDGLEPVNSGALRSDIVVNDQERQTVIGYGWGAGRPRGRDQRAGQEVRAEAVRLG